MLGAGAGAAMLPVGTGAMAGPFSKADVSDHLVPADKKLADEWVASLTKRGEPEVFSLEQLKYVGMPVGGQLYLAGDGRLWLWDIFKCNYVRESGHGNYRRCRPDSAVTMRDCVIDSKDAVRYLAKNSDTLKLDPTRFFAMGHSAGGQIAQMLLLSSPETLPGAEELAPASYWMLAGVSWYGPCDFKKTELFNHDDRADFRNRFAPRILGSDPNPASKLDRYREMSPASYLRKDSPPLLLIQGDKDTTIPVKHAYYIKPKADAARSPVEIILSGTPAITGVRSTRTSIHPGKRSSNAP